MSKYFQFVVMCVLVLLSILGIFFTSFSQEAKPAYASTLATNSLVIIPIDATGKNCTTTFQTNMNTSHPTIIRRACSPGTVIGTQFVPLAQAVEMHTPYVVPAPRNASVGVKNSVTQEIRNMMRKERQKLLVSPAKNMISPLTACGGNGGWGVNWSPDGIGEYSRTILIYRSTDCSTIYFTQSRMLVDSHTYCEYSWISDAYAGNWYSPPGQPILNTIGHLYSYNVDQSASQGYYYENWVSSLASAPGCTAGYDYYVNMGLIS